MPEPTNPDSVGHYTQYYSPAFCVQMKRIGNEWDIPVIAVPRLALLNTNPRWKSKTTQVFKPYFGHIIYRAHKVYTPRKKVSYAPETIMAISNTGDGKSKIIEAVDKRIIEVSKEGGRDFLPIADYSTGWAQKVMRDIEEADSSAYSVIHSVVRAVPPGTTLQKIATCMAIAGYSDWMDLLTDDREIHDTCTKTCLETCGMLFPHIAYISEDVTIAKNLFGEVEIIDKLLPMYSEEELVKLCKLLNGTAAFLWNESIETKQEAIHKCLWAAMGLCSSKSYSREVRKQLKGE